MVVLLRFMKDSVKHKTHRERNAGRKAEKKKAKNQHVQELTDKQKNPKAFTFNSAIKAERRFRRKQDIETKKQHIPVVDRTPLEPPPILVAVVGPPKVGKSLLIQCLIKSYVKQPLTNIVGPVTVVSGKKRRITFMECNNDISCMIDIAKVADLVLLLVDASFGFEMEVFEFLNICQVHGMPRIMGVLTHLDLFKNAKQLRKTKKILKHRFWTEVYAGAKLFYLSGLIHDEYLRTEIKNLARFISVMKFRPLTWRTSHPYILADRIEDLTSPELIRKNAKVDRTICLYGYVRGVPLNKESSIHIPGCGDLRIKDVSYLPDPCPLPEQLKKRALIEKERLIYAPFSGIGGIVYDKDAVYVELAGSHSHKEEDTGLTGALMDTRETLDQKLQYSELQLFSDTAPIKSQDINEDFNSHYIGENVVEDGRIRRKVIFPDSEETAAVSDEDSDGSEEEDNNIEEFNNKELNNDEDDIKKNTSRKGIKRKNQDLQFITSRQKKKKVHFTNSNEEDSDVDDDFEDNDNKEVKNKTEIEVYHSLSKESDIQVKNKITEALSFLEASTSKKDIDESDNESFDELSDDDSRGDLEIDNSNDDNDFQKERFSKETKNHDTDESEEEIADEFKWKSNLLDKAKKAFINRRESNKSLMKIVYGVFDKGIQNNDKEEKEQEDENDNEPVGGIFKVVQEKQKEKLQERELQNLDECVFFSKEPSRDWLDEDNKVLLLNCFVTGKWKESEDAEELLKLDDMDEDEVYGDFEDLETGEKHKADDSQQSQNNEINEKKKLLEKKKKLKEQFDAEYDNGESKSYYDELKQEVDKQAELNKSEFEGLDDDIRVQLEGYRPGMYVRVEIQTVPCEIITNLDPSYPLIIGGLLHGEENIGYVHTRIKKHRWYSRILKSKDPLILSVGWRRFQTLPIYSKLEDNLRSRMLKYTPEHVACMAHFWGPITPQGTGVLAVQDIATREPGFRIAGTGSIVEMDKSTQIMKKLKLTGVPMKIYKKTAFIKDMFNSTLEVAKFEGAKIKTVSGIRGQIKKAVSKPEGCFRASFEDKILLSDIVFCRTWYRIEVPKFYNPVTSLLLPPAEKNQWRGMKTTGQLKREKNIRATVNTDSLYIPIERSMKVFKPLVIPRNLQKELPYKDKPKFESNPHTRKTKFEDRRVAVVRDAKEENVARLMKMIRTSYAYKQKQLRKATVDRVRALKARVTAEERRKLKKQKEYKKQIFRDLSKLEKKNKKI
ncbi:hypothetical protein HZH66_013279 [Vespula vulgaris]|uniref:Bms1-type G domain-containing protein n=1 Tax=Vespula vulgaris TaxID=7454 RepID=A0A834MRP1_VESVU|nr:hypothetical protein HZH66_013279 [Vespula vulgaris]